MELGSKLRKARESKRISQQEIAEFLNISQKTYSNIEGDKSKPSLIQLSKLGELLDFDMLELLKEQGLVFNQKNEHGANNGIVNTNLPEKLIAQYEARIIELKEMNTLLRDKITGLEK